MAKNKMAKADSVEGITSQYPAERPAMGMTSVKNVRFASAEDSPYTTLMKRQNAKSMDPAFMPIGKRTYTPYERGGAKFGIPVRFQAVVAPEAGATQANGRVFKSAIKRQAPNFQMGSMDLN